MKIAVLWPALSGYFNACLRALDLDGHQLLVSSFSPKKNAPFDGEQFSWLNRHVYMEWGSGYVNERVLMDALEEFEPDVILISSWHIGAYRKVGAAWKNRCLRVLAMDNQWLGTMKQRLGCLVSRWYIKPIYDAVFVPGERQYQFARRLGFPDRTVLRGLYACDYPSFSSVREAASQPEESFVYVGRLSSEKGVGVLRDAYRYYRKLVDKPWPLVVYGSGPLRTLLDGVAGIELHGFVQPMDLPQRLSQHACFVIASTFEPWALAIHEATATGRPVICTAACGASVHLVIDGYNGYLVEKNHVEGLAYAMLKMSNLETHERLAFGERSRQLAQQFTPERWAKYLAGWAMDWVSAKKALK